MIQWKEIGPAHRAVYARVCDKPIGRQDLAALLKGATRNSSIVIILLKERSLTG
jgi:hypothetical protein